MKKTILTEREIIDISKSNEKIVYVDNNTIITPLALDRIKVSGLKIINKNDIRQNGDSGLLNSIGNKSLFGKIAIGSDHTGLELKMVLVDLLKSMSLSVLDIGVFNKNRADYPDIAKTVARHVKAKDVECGILIDASGIPSAIVANKYKGIRAATCYNEFSARSCREHNDANILVLGALSLGVETCKSILNVFLSTRFLGERHKERLDKISLIESENFK